jgi:hypothetical protein
MRKYVACVSLAAAVMLVGLAPAGALAHSSQAKSSKRDFIVIRSHHAQRTLFVQRSRNHTMARVASCLAGNITPAYCSPPSEQTLFGAYAQSAGATTFGSTSTSACKALGYTSEPCGVNTTAANELIVAFTSADGPSSGGQSINVTCTVGGTSTACPVTWHKVASENAGGGGDSEVWYADAPSIVSSTKPYFVTATAAKAGCPSGSVKCDVSLQVVTFQNAITVGAAGAQGTGIGASSTCYSAKAAPSCAITTTEPYSQVWSEVNDWGAAAIPTWPSTQFAIGVADSVYKKTFYTQFLGTCTSSSCAPLSLPADGLYQNPFSIKPTDNMTAGTKVTISDSAPTTDPFNMVDVEIL